MDFPSPQIFGIRHHGPGSSIALRKGLNDFKPEIILVEGPPDADDLIEWLAHPDMEPPIALLIYRPDEPKRATYYPFAIFSPELQALRYGLEQKITVRFMDLPQAHMLAVKEKPKMPDGEVFSRFAKAIGHSSY